jgi:septal ring-binding cell division protein DamX
VDPPHGGYAPVAYALGGLAIGGILGIAAFASYQGFSAPKVQIEPTASAPVQYPANVPEATVPASAAAMPTAVPGSPPEASAAAMSSPPDVLEQRLLATDHWLGEQNGAFYSIQLLGSDDPELLREYFKTIAKYLEIDKVYVYRTVANRHPSLTVLYGTFATRNEVTQTLQGLPDELKFNRPYYRTIQGIRSEIARPRS